MTFETDQLNNYREFPVPKLLRPYVQKFWHYRGPLNDEILPCGSSDVVFHLGGAPYSKNHQGIVKAEPRIVVAGQITSPIQLWTSGNAEVAGVRLTPTGAFSLLGIDARGVTNSSIGLEDLIAIPGDLLLDELHQRSDPRVRIRMIEQFLLERLPRTQHDAQIEAASQEIVRSFGTIRINLLADKLGLSQRSLQRRFQEMVGISPKLLARIIRVHSAIHAARHAPSTPWTLIAHRFGYSDQAHFTRDCRSICGKPPTALTLTVSPMNQAFQIKSQTPAGATLHLQVRPGYLSGSFKTSP